MNYSKSEAIKAKTNQMERVARELENTAGRLQYLEMGVEPNVAHVECQAKGTGIFLVGSFLSQDFKDTILEMAKAGMRKEINRLKADLAEKQKELTQLISEL
jgi:endonuclease III